MLTRLTEQKLGSPHISSSHVRTSRNFSWLEDSLQLLVCGLDNQVGVEAVKCGSNQCTINSNQKSRNASIRQAISDGERSERGSSK